MAATVRSASTYASVASETSFSMPLPAGFAAGDVCYIFAEGRATTGAFGTTPTGWTAVAASFTSGSNTSSFMVTYRRVMQAADGSPAIAGTSGRYAAVCVAVQGADNTTPEDVTVVTDNGGVSAITTITSPGIAPAGTDDLLLIGFGCGDPTTANTGISFSAPSGMTIAAQVASALSGSTDAGMMAAGQALSGASPTGTRVTTVTTSPTAGNINGQSVTIAVRSAAAGVTPVPSGMPLPVLPPGWFPGLALPGMPGGEPFAAWPPAGFTAAKPDSLDAAAAVTAAASASLAVSKAAWELPPPVAPAWFPSAPSAPGAEPFTAWPVWAGATAKSDALTAASTVTAASTASLTESKPLNAASTVTASAAAAETTSKPLNAAQTVTAALAASLDVVKAGITPVPAYPPAWFPSAPGVPGGEPFAPWPAWTGSGGVSTPQDLLTAAATVTAAGAAALTESKPLNAALTVTAGRTAAETAAKPLNAAAVITAGALASLAVQAAVPGSFTAPRLYAPAWFPGAPAVPAAEAFAPWPPRTGLLAALPPAVVFGKSAVGTGPVSSAAPGSSGPSALAGAGATGTAAPGSSGPSASPGTGGTGTSSPGSG